MSRRKKKTRNNIDASSAVVKTISNNKGKISKIKDPVESYGYRRLFTSPEYDLAQISMIEDGESYVRQAFQKMTSLMFKEGEVFTGKNQQTIDYIKSRIRQIEFASGVPWRHLLKITGKELISKSNFFWVKVRSKNKSGGDKGANRKLPVAAYFPMGAENVRVKKNKDGKIIKYRQEMPDGRWKEFSPEDVIHFKTDVKPGFTFGTPRIVPVIPDIQALRRLEENVEILFYQTLFPIFQYTVGTDNKPAGAITLPDGQVIDEVEYIRQQIATMPTEGGIVTPERHKIEYIGANGQIPNYQNVLAYFKQRVLAGLGISSVDIGEGDTANRATADSLSKALIDSVKHYQEVFEHIINHQVIADLLLEMDTELDVLHEDNYVAMKFKEIDIEEQMKKNVNAQLMFNADIWDINEAREVTGKQPLREDQEELMFTERQTMRVLDAEAEHGKDLAKIGAAQQAGSSSNAKANTNKSKAAANTARNKNSPTNQRGTNTGPQKSRQDRWIRNEERILLKLQEIMDVESDDYKACVESARLRLVQKARQLDNKEERNSFIEKVEIRLSAL